MLSARLSQHVATTQFGSLPASTVHACCRALLDGLGVMLAASGSSAEVAPFVQLALAGEASPGEAAPAGTAAVFGTPRRGVSAALAAFANGAMAHALDYEDAYDAAPVHPNASLLPAVIALAQARAPVSGRELVTAIAVGCDLVCRLASCLRRPMEDGGWYPPPILGAFGAAAGAARLLRLTPDQVCDTWSLMLCQTSCPGEIKYSPDSVLRAVREAFPAQAAVVSALLAEAGIKGFSAPLEGKAGFFRLYAADDYDPQILLQDLGTHYFIEDLSFKRWPCCRGIHAYIEIVQRLRATHGFTARDVARVRLDVGTVQQMLIEPLAAKLRPATGIDAKFSLPFCVAVALVDADVTLDSFAAARRGDPGLLAVAARIDFQRRDDWGRDRAAAGQLEIVLHDGRRFEGAVDQALGHPGRPIDDAGLIAKFVDCAGRAATPLSPDTAAALAARILSLPDLADVGAALRT